MGRITQVNKWMATAALLTAAAGCTVGEDLGADDHINEYLRSLPLFPVEDADRSESAPSDPESDGDYQCITYNVSETKQYDKIVAFQANSETLWPGSIVGSDAINTGLFAQIGFDRAPLKYSISHPNLQGRKFATLQNPSLSEYRETLGNLLAIDVSGETPADIYYEVERVDSEESLNLAVGVNANWGTGHVNASFDFQNENIRSRYVVKFIQAYYTVDVDMPQNPGDFLADTVTLDEVRAKANQENPPVFVSSITYGRSVYFTFESEYSYQEMGAALDFAFGVGTEISGDISVTYSEMLDKSKITARILGGSGQDAVQTIDGKEALLDFIREGGTYSKDSPGAPIAYKLAHWSDNSPARFSLTDDYEVRECHRISQKVLVTFDKITVLAENGAGSDVDLYGTVWAGTGPASGSPSPSYQTMWNRGSNSWISLNVGESFPAGNDPITETVLNVKPEDGEAIFLQVKGMEHDGFLNGDDNLGTSVEKFSFETGWRREASVYLNGGGNNVRFDFTLTPI